MPTLPRFTPTIPVSVVITHCHEPGMLELTLAALERQTYPLDLFEVVVVTGLDISLTVPPAPLRVSVVPHPSGCDGPAWAHNAGARAASHPILVFLDCGVIPEADWLAAHARWHHEACDVLTFGFEARVDIDGISTTAVRSRRGRLRGLFRHRPHTQPERIEFHMVRTNHLTSVSDDLFRVASSNNVGISSEFFELVGGFDESFAERRFMNLHFGFRAYTLGGLCTRATSLLLASGVKVGNHRSRTAAFGNRIAQGLPSDRSCAAPPSPVWPEFHDPPLRRYRRSG